MDIINLTWIIFLIYDTPTTADLYAARQYYYNGQAWILVLRCHVSIK